MPPAMICMACYTQPCVCTQFVVRLCPPALPAADDVVLVAAPALAAGYPRTPPAAQAPSAPPPAIDVVARGDVAGRLLKAYIDDGSEVNLAPEKYYYIMRRAAPQSSVTISIDDAITTEDILEVVNNLKARAANTNPSAVADIIAHRRHGGDTEWTYAPPAKFTDIGVPPPPPPPARI